MANMSASVVCFVLFLATTAVWGQGAPDSLRFLAVGDIGGQTLPPYTTHEEIATAVEMTKIADKYSPQFVLELGDNFYTFGVTSVTDKRFNETFEKVFSAHSMQIPWYIIAGNHDHYGNTEAQIQYSHVSSRWHFPYYYYRFNYTIPNSDKVVDFVMLDTILLCESSTPAHAPTPAQQMEFLENALRSSQATYLFVSGHHPVYSIGSHGPTACIVSKVLPLLYKYHVNAYFCGHDHDLQHLQTTHDGVTVDFIVSGAGHEVATSTAHLHSVPSGSLKFNWADSHAPGGFVYAETTTAHTTFYFIDSNGKSLYNTTLSPRVPPADIIG